jgi:sugar phosphate isomerase/epimerase
LNFGVSTMMVTDLPFEEGMGKIARAGFTQVELSGWGRLADLWLKDPKHARQTLAATGLRALSVHTPEAGWDNDSPDESARRASVERASSVFGPAAQLGVEVAVVHLNARVTHDFVEAERADNVARSIESLQVLAERARSHGLRLAVENMPARNTPRPGARVADLLKIIDGLGPQVGICLDAGHANSNELSAAEEVRVAGARAFAVHIQDNDGLGQDQHLLPGEGTTDWRAFLAALRNCAPSCICNFEVPAVNNDPDWTLAALAAIAKKWNGTARGA